MYVFLCLALTLIILSEMTFSRQTLGSAFTWQDSRDFRDGLITEVKRNKSRKWGLVEQRCQGDSISISSHALMLLQARSQYFFPSFPAQRPGHRNTNTLCPPHILQESHKSLLGLQTRSPAGNQEAQRHLFFHLSIFHIARTQPTGSQTYGLQPSEGFDQPLEFHTILSQKDKAKTKNKNRELLVHATGSVHKKLQIQTEGISPDRPLWGSLYYLLLHLVLLITYGEGTHFKTCKLQLSKLKSNGSYPDDWQLIQF